MAACIQNDIPYPKLLQSVLSLAAEGQEGPATIDDKTLTVVVHLAEATNPKKVQFTEFTYTEGAECSRDLLDGTYDLTQPLEVTLSKYQDYTWLISAAQSLTRNITIAGQVGQSVIDDVGRRIIIYVPESADLSNLQLTSIKLGPEGVTSYSPSMDGGYFDFRLPFKVAVTYWDETQVWTIYVQKTKQIVSTTAVDAWAKVIWAYGSAPADAKNGFQYRAEGSEEWIDVPDNFVTHDGGSFVARIPHLAPLSTYVVRAISDDNIGNEITVTTEATTDLVDGSFDQWWQDGAVWNPWDQNGVQYWDTGNMGAATLGQSNVQPSDYTPTGRGKSAMLETRYLVIKLAAGSIYTGKFAKVDGTNGIVDFGQPFNCRPTKLRGYYDYRPATIDKSNNEYSNLIGRPDSCHIFIALTDWTAPFQVRTNPNNRQLFDKNASYIIAYGEIVRGDATNGYEAFEITLDYRSTSKVPTYLQITCAASKYGDFFTGGTGSLLYVDEFSFDFDY